MFRKFVVLIFSFLFLLNIYGCALLLVGAAGAAGGIGTATWLSGKLVQEVNAPFDGAIKASKSALKSLELKVTKETVKGEEGIAQVMSSYNDGKTVWIDVHRVSEKISRVEIRVGVDGDQEAERKILDKILKCL